MENPREYLRQHPECLLLYAVTDSAWLAGRTLPDCVADAIAGGATFVQLREKALDTPDMVQAAKAVMERCGDVPFVVNDDVDAAVACGADGVHVGQSDAACEDARAKLGPGKIVGVSAQTVEQALAAQAAGADYLGVGALYSTATKTDAADVSLEELAAICKAVDIPVVGIGGMNASTVHVLEGTGAVGAAVVSALFAADDVKAAAQDLRERLEHVVHA